MCGIAGIISPGLPVERRIISNMCQRLEHRGPDDSGDWYSPDGCVGLTHRRLSIIDLSAKGHQPMRDSTGQIVIVFNGEIYNYQELRLELEKKGRLFYTHSDTEVILEAYKEWGDDCVLRLNGMFAFCIYDIRKQRIFVSRDRCGEKPFFYFCDQGNFVFASELKALMEYPGLKRNIDPAGLRFYFAYGYIPGEYSILSGVKKLPPAHTLSFQIPSGSLRVRRYWELPLPEEKLNSDTEELAAELERLLTDAVRRQLVADVPVGVLLSGGIDSSLITALASRVSEKPVKTFTVTFPGELKFDESRHAKLIADFFKTEHLELAAQVPDSDLLSGLVRQYDEPVCDSSIIPTYLVSKLISRNTKVALGGDGGDELFAGYQAYNRILQQRRLKRLLPVFLRAGVGAIAERFLPLGARGREFLLETRGDVLFTLSRSSLFFDEYSLARLIKPLSEGSISTVRKYKAGLCQPRRGLPGMMMALDFNSYLPEDILVKVDRASMLNSLEIRSPFLDHRVVEFAFSRVPNHLRADFKERKILLKYTARRILPAQIDLQRKQGFSVPLESWFKGGFGKTVKEILSEADPRLFDQKKIQQLLRNQEKGYSNSERIFALVIFELWRREYKAVI